MELMKKTDDDIEVIHYVMPNRVCIARLALSAGGQHYKDTEIGKPTGGQLKAARQELNGSLPLLVYRGITMSQSQNIALFAAHLACVQAENPLERVLDQQYLCQYEEITSLTIKLSQEKGMPFQQRNENVTEMMIEYFKPIEDSLPEDGWIHGGRTPTLADLSVFAVASYAHPKNGPVLGWTEYCPRWSEKYPKICAMRDRVRALPTMLDYLKKWNAFHAVK